MLAMCPSKARASRVSFTSSGNCAIAYSNQEGWVVMNNIFRRLKKTYCVSLKH